MAKAFTALLVVAAAFDATLGDAVGEELQSLRGPCKRRARLLLSSRSSKLILLQDDAHQQKAGAEPEHLDRVVIRRSIEELEIAKSSSNLAGASANEAKTVQQNFVADTAIVRATATWEKVRPLSAKARAMLLLIRKYNAEAQLHRKHAQEVILGSRSIPGIAAAKALEALQGWIKLDAAASAEASHKHSSKIDRLAAAVAAAVEPYHLALLRNQKFCAETYAKAKSAQSSSVKLITDSKKIALKAQEMIAAGKGVDGQQTYAGAVGMINEAESLRQWGNKLYGEANAACGSAGGYEALEQQAAANAAATTIINAPMALPPN